MDAIGPFGTSVYNQKTIRRGKPEYRDIKLNPRETLSSYID
jgi:hypothetical protein